MKAERIVSGVFSLLLGLASVAGTWWWMTRTPPAPPPPEPFPPHLFAVTVAPVEKGSVSERVELIGDVRAPDRSTLAFERAGRIHELPIRLGDVVKAGGVLARLDDVVMKEAVRAREASLSQSREMADLAAREAERLKRLEGVGATDAEIDRAAAGARNEAAKVAQMEADVALEKARLQQGVLLAPFDAVVTSLEVAVGTYVAAGDACCELLSLERREIVLEIPSGIAAAAPRGASVALTSDSLPGFELSARLDSVLPSRTAHARTFQGVVRLGPQDDPEHRLLPGLFVRGRLELRAAQDALVVPVDALLFDERGASLATVKPGETPVAAIAAVTVLARDADRAAVQPRGDAPLAAGDLVILTGKENVFPGALLKPTAAKADAAGS
jgi:RND family efflux transporter MFP subunit